MIKLLGQGPLYTVNKYKSRLQYEADRQRHMIYFLVGVICFLVAWIIWSGS